MKAQPLIDAVDLAHADLAPYIPDLAGIAVIAITWQHDDDDGIGIAVQMAADLPPDLVDLAIDMLHWARDARRPDGTRPITEVRRRLRKGV
jgi:hypothetical protein